MCPVIGGRRPFFRSHAAAHNRTHARRQLAQAERLGDVIVRAEIEPGNAQDRQIEVEDLQKIVSGMISVVDGIGALRTRASSAHGARRKRYAIEGRHARLAVHAAHTIATFILSVREANQPPPRFLFTSSSSC
jgi:hypothetical protein